MSVYEKMKCSVEKGAMLAVLSGVLAWGTSLNAGVNTPAEFTITKDILVPREGIAPIGVNKAGNPGLGLSCGYSVNNFLRVPTEPVNARLMGRVIKMFDDGAILQEADMGVHDARRSSGYFSGAKVRVYRLVDKEGNNLPLKKSKAFDNPKKPKDSWIYNDVKNADHLKFIGETTVIPEGTKGYPKGGWICATKDKKNPRNGRITQGPDWEKSRIYFTKKLDLHYGDYMFFEKRMTKLDRTWFKKHTSNVKPTPPKEYNYGWKSKSCLFSFEAHTDVPEEMFEPGDSCLRVDVKEKDTISANTIGGDTYYGNYEEGKKYRMEVWLKQKGLQGTVDFKESVAGNASFQVTDKWQKFTCDFIGKKNKGLGRASFSMNGPGTLWMDNPQIFGYEKEEELTQILKEPSKVTLDELIDSQPKTGEKGTIRFWAGLGQMSMKSLCSTRGDSKIVSHIISIRKMQTIPQPLKFTECTGDSPETRMIPWLIIQVTFTEQDYRNLIEYLAAPFDPAKDTKESKPFAYMRYKQRGHATPWTDSFREIIIEYGNENWHNRYPLFPFWIGFGEYCAIHQGGKEFGIWTKYYTEEIMKSPYWESENLESKIKFCLGGNYSSRIEKNGKVTGYGQEATQANGYNTYEGHANYVGPLWELGQSVKRGLSDQGFQGTLLSYAAGSKSRHENTGASWNKLREQGFTKHYNVSYEGGPSGYSITGKGLTKEDKDTIQKYGKSMAMGVTAVDCWLDTYRLGFKHHCIYFYGQGGGWASHNYMNQGFLPNPGFMGIEMRNNMLTGDMLKNTSISTPILPYGKTGNMVKALSKSKTGLVANTEKRDIPLTTCYSFRDGDRYSVAVISLKLDGEHNDLDFGDGYTPVKLNLPFKSAKKIYMQKMVGDPRDTNLEGEKITIVKQDVSIGELKNGVFVINKATGSDKDAGIPPGTVFMYAFEGCK